MGAPDQGVGMAQVCRASAAAPTLYCWGVVEHQTPPHQGLVWAAQFHHVAALKVALGAVHPDGEERSVSAEQGSDRTGVEVEHAARHGGKADPPSAGAQAAVGGEPGSDLLTSCYALKAGWLKS